MKAHSLPIPGVMLGPYPERRASAQNHVSGLFHLVSRVFALDKSTYRYERFIQRVSAYEAQIAGLDAAALEQRLTHTRAAIAREGLIDERIAEAFAAIKCV